MREADIVARTIYHYSVSKYHCSGMAVSFEFGACAMIYIVVEGAISKMFQAKLSNLRVLPFAFGPDIMLVPDLAWERRKAVTVCEKKRI